MNSTLPPLRNNSILVVEDEVEVAHSLAADLSAAGFRVFEAEDGATAIAMARREAPVLIVLDLALPGMSGLEVTRALKCDPATLPISILLLSARNDEVDRIIGFELGADDFVARPFNTRELVLRVKAIVRRKTGSTKESGIYRCGPIVVDEERHTTTLRGHEIELTAIEFKLLLALMKGPERVLSRDEFVVSIWGVESDVGTRTIDTHVRRLRKKLGGSVDQIQTVRGVGYRIDVP